MEKTKQIDPKEIIKGYFIDLTCCMCWDEKRLAAATKKELIKLIKEEGWQEINSDEYGVIGHWCGCDYKDET